MYVTFGPIRPLEIRGPTAPENPSYATGLVASTGDRR